MRRVISLLLTVVLLVGLVPTNAFVEHAHAAETDVPDYRWELNPTTSPYLISSTENGITENAITLASGITVGEDGSFANGYKGRFTTAVALANDKHWVIEWKVTGDWKGELLSQRGKVTNDNTSRFIRRDSATGLVAMGSIPKSTTDLSTVAHYGITVPTSQFDANTTYTWRLENKVAADGSNMVYLWIDDTEIGALNTYYLNSVADTSVDGTWVNGKDFSMGYVGANDDLLTTTKLEYLQIWLDKPVDSAEHVHEYEVTEEVKPTCTTEGSKTYTCSCGDTYTETVAVDSSKHTFTSGWISENGEMHRLCDACEQYVTGMVAYRWEMNEAGDALVSVTTDGNTENALTVADSVTTLAVSGGEVTDYKARLATAVALNHDQDWAIEWKSDDWMGMMLSSTGNIDAGAEYLWRNNEKNVVALGARVSGVGSANYGGISLADAGLDMTQPHVWRVENRVAADGTNMVYLVIDDVEIGAMNNYYVGSTSQDTTSDWVKGHDFEFKYLGASDTQLLNTTQLEYIQIWTNGMPDKHTHNYTLTGEVQSTCSAEGYKTYVCSCGETKTETIPKDTSKHNYSDGWVSKDDEMRRYCADCGEYITGMVAYRWEYDATNTAYMTSVTTDGNTANALALGADSVVTEDGDFTSYKAKMATEATLTHDQEWVIEWKVTGDWTGMLLSDSGRYRTENSTEYIYRNSEKGLMSIGYREKNTSAGHNYGLSVPTDQFDPATTYVWRLENRIAADGSNMVYLLIDGEEIGALNKYHLKSELDESVDGNWLNGQDFAFYYFGTTESRLAANQLEYLQIWTNGELHHHDYEVVTTVPGTCVTPAETTYTCGKCGHTYTETGAVDPAKHTGNNTTGVNAKAPTCGEAGYTGDTVCECGAKVAEGEEIAATGEHTDVINDGDHKCDVCSAADVSEHTGGEATCMAEAVCIDCKQSYGEKDAANHTNVTHVENEKAATCAVAGYTGDTVCECGVTVVEGEEIPATGNHTDKELDGDHKCETCDKADVTAHSGGTATCMAAAVCAECAQPYGEKDAANHTGHNTVENAKAATCTATGYTGDTVCECGVTVQTGSEIEKLAHSWGDWVTTKEATEQEVGAQERQCSVCQEKEQREIPKLSHVHVPVKVEAVEAGCATTGNIEHWICSGCDRRFSEEACQNELQNDAWVIPATGAHTDAAADGDHKCDNCPAEDVTAHSGGKATCMAAAVCSDCGQSYGTVDAGNHTQKTTLKNAKEATCGEAGYTGDVACECGAKLEDGQVIPATGEHKDAADDGDHKCDVCSAADVSEHTGGLATCVALPKCSDCGQSYGAKNPESHTGVNFTGVNAKEATCGEDGYTGDTVCECGVTVKEGTVISANGNHTEAANDGDHTCDVCGTENVSVHVGGTATCVAQALCSDCGQPHGEVDATNHTGNNTAGVNAKAPTCSAAGYTGDTVCECGAKVAEGEAIPATGEHTYGDWTVSGSNMSRKCQNCETVETVPLRNYRWEMNEAGDALVSITENGNTENALTVSTNTSGLDVSGGVLTNFKASVATAINLRHESEWAIEWKSAGDWKGMMLSSTGTIKTGAEYLWRNNTANVVALGAREESGSKVISANHAAISLADAGIDMTQSHVWRVENRVAADGSNMVYLVIDDIEIGAMNNYYKGSTSQDTTSDWINGHDFEFKYLGASDTQLLNEMKLDYLQIWAAGTEHKHAYKLTSEAEATCVTAGKKVYTCYCGYVNTVELGVDADNHTGNNTVKNAKAATCKEAGYTGDTVCECGVTVQTGSVIEKLTTHSWGEWITTKPATEQETGTEEHTCSVCGATEQRTIPVLSHVHAPKLVEAVAATCGAAGNIEYWTCTSCGRNYSEEACQNELAESDIILPATGNHTAKETVGAKDATCGEDGYTGDVICVCGATITKGTKIPATGNHSWSEWKVNQDVVSRECANCNTVESVTLESYRWEINASGDALVSSAENGNTKNDLTVTHGTVSGGLITGFRASMASPVTLYSDSAWVIEWKAGGNWKGMMLSSNGTVDLGAEYLWRNNTVNVMALGVKGEKTASLNHAGISLAEAGLDMTQPHVWRVENRVNADGSNMVYLVIDDIEIGAMNNDYKGSTSQNATSDWANGHDFVFNYIGAESSTQLLSEMELEYLQIWTGGTEHKHAYTLASETEADCMTVSQRTYICDCGETLVDKGVVDASKHTGNNHVENQKDAGCEEDGYTGDTVCECGTVIQTGSVIEKLNHSWSEWKVIEAATNDAAGLEQRACVNCHKTENRILPPTGFSGKTVSILGDSISTYVGVSNDGTANSTIADNRLYYSTPGGVAGIFQEDTWWQQVIDIMDLELLVNNSWSGSRIFGERRGAAPAYIDRCVQLHNDTTNEEPDIILSFMGTNDMSYGADNLGTPDVDENQWGSYEDLDFDALIQSTGDGTYMYEEPQTVYEAYAIMLHKMTVRYPDTRIYVMGLMARRDPVAQGDDVGQPTSRNACIKQLAEHFGCTFIEMENCISSDPADFDVCMADQRVHPSKEGHDRMTEAVVGALLGEQVDIRKVTYNLSNATSSNNDHTVLVGGAYQSQVTMGDGYSITGVKVTMGGENITESVYANGVISIDRVTDDIVITAFARNPYVHRWEYNSTTNTMESIVTDELTANELKLTNGSITEGVFTNLGYKLTENIPLPHDKEWIVEWKSAGDWKGMLFSSTGTINPGSEYLYRNNNTGLVAFGYRDESKTSQNYGVVLPANQFDLSQPHVWRVENRVAADGSNMIWLVMDDVEIGAMNNYYVGSTNKNTTSDWVSGHDFTFSYMGASTTQLLSNMSMEYMQVWTDDAAHKHAYTTSNVVEGTCAAKGSVTYTCRCGYSYQAETDMNPDNHNFGEWASVNGVMCRECEECGKMETAYAFSYRWDMNQAGTALENNTAEDFIANALVNPAGTVSGGKLSGYYAKLTTPVILFHDQQWAIQWKCVGTWNSMLLSATKESTDGDWYLFSNANNVVAFGYYGQSSTSSKNAYKNYGTDLDEVLTGFDWTTEHTWRLENRVAADGSNMIWLVVDGKSVCAMNTYFEGSTKVAANDNTLGGKDLIFNYIGTSNKPLETSLTYLQIWPDDESHTHKYIETNRQSGTCGKEGTVTSTCSCGATITFSDGIPAPHAYTEWVATDGIMRRECTECGLVETRILSTYRWEMNSEGTKLVSITANGGTKNDLTVSEGTIADGTMEYYASSMNNTVLLTHDNAWNIEWKASGDWKGMLLVSKEVVTTEGSMYVYRNPDNDMFVMGVREGNKYHNYGIMMTDSGIDFEQSHVWRLENRVATDGSNMVYLLVDGVEIGAMNNYYIGSAAQEGTSDWVSGKDFAFNYIGSCKAQQLNNIKLEYLQIQTCAEPHLHQYQITSQTESTCAKVGETVYTCSSCGEFYSELSSVIIPHTFNEWTLTNGIYYHECKVCGVVENENQHAYRWEMNSSRNDLVSTTDDGSQRNLLTKVNGTITAGTVTDYVASMAKKVTLAHNKEWTIEWSSAGDWKGMMLLSAQKDVDNTVYLYRNSENGMIVFGVNEDDVHHNYGIMMNDSDIDFEQPHVWRLENRVAADGSNMVYLMIDDLEIGAMNNYFKASNADDSVDGNWLNGRDLTFGFIGASDGKPLTGINLEYLQIWTEATPHKHAYVIDEESSTGTCIEKITYLGVCSCGETTYIPSEEYGDHVYSDWAVVGEEKQRVCQVCNIVDTVTMGAHYDVSVSKDYYKVISQKNYVLCDGVTESQIILNNAEGTRRQILNVVEVDTANPNVEILAGYYGVDKDLTNPDNWSARTVDETMDYYRDELGYNVVAGMNTALDYDTPAPTYFLVYNGKVLASDDGNYNDAADSYMAVIKNDDGTVRCEMRSIDDPLTGNEWQAIACNDTFAVKNGKLVKKTVSHSGMSVRSLLGIKKDGSLVIVQSEGENPARASGLNHYEIGETMKALGCEWALIGDGGGSSQILTKREGESDHTLRNQPSDGTARATTNSIIIASKVTSTGEFDHLSMLPESEYISPKASTNIKVKGVDGAGAPAEMPEGITYKATGGTYKNGVFTADGTVGEQTVTAYYNGEEVGQVKINVVVPTAIYFDREEMAVPYGKSVEIALKASYGSRDVAFCADDIKFALTQKIGTIDGLTFKAIEDDGSGESITAMLTATLVHDKSLTAEIFVLVGKGSEAVYDFEDKNLHGWYRTTASEYNHVSPNGETYIVNASNGKVHSGKYAMAAEIDYSNNLEGGFQSAILRTSEKKVFTNASTIGMWVYFPDEADGLSVYMTTPVYEDSEGEKKSSNVIYSFANISGVGDTETTDTGFVYGMDESGWRYIEQDVSGYPYTGVPVLQIYISQKSGKNGYNYGYQSSVNGQYVLYVDDLTVDYSQAVDDREVPIFSGMTYNAGGIVDDVNGNVVSTGNLSFTAAVQDNQSKSNYTGIDMASGRVYVDGMDRTAALTWSADGSQMSLNNVYLSSGMHTIKFGVSDRAGNYNSIVRTIIVGSADSAKVKVVPHDPFADRLLLGSLYYIDVVADDPETISRVEVTMDLNNISVWELDHMDVAEGFEAAYTLIEDENIATVTITSTGTTNLSGNDQILVSIPTRTWELEPNEPIYEHTDIYMYDSYKAYNGILPMDLTVEIDAGFVSYKSGASATFTSPKIKVDTEMCGNGATDSGDAELNYIGDEPWYAEWNGGHDHRDYTKQYYKEGSTNHVDAIALDDKAATCTEDGYSGRTFCEVCNSVVNWGTAKPATGHKYKVVSGVLQCTACGDLFNGVYTDGKYYVDGVVPADGWAGNSYIKDGVLMTGVKKVPSPENAEEEYYYDFGEDGVCKDKTPYTGVFKDGDAYYYAYSGVLKNGWQSIDDEYYYFSTKTNAAASGRVKVDGVYFNFEENGRLISGTWVTTDEGKRYYYGPGYYQELWAEIDGDWYYFKEGYAQTGVCKVRRFNYFSEWAWTDLGEEGKFTFDYLDGFFLENNKYLHYAIDGVDLQGLYQIGSDFYFFASNGRAATGEYYAWETHCSLPCGTYTFGPDGKMINPPVVDPLPADPTGKDGLSHEADGIYYCVDGQFGPAGITKIGDYYYFVSSKGRVATGTYYCWATNCEIPCGTYEFDSEGRMLNPPVVEPDDPADPSLKNGLVQESDGIYYYINGKFGPAGITKIGNYYYFVSSKGRVATGSYYCWATNCEIPCGTYEFDSKGRMTNPPTGDSSVKNGLVQESDGIYYYVNGKYGTAGITKIGDYYYFVSSKGRVATGSYYCWATNCEIPCGTYNFDSKGRMTNPPVDGAVIPPAENGLVEQLDGIYYYVDGEYGPAGITKIGDYYYFVSSKGRVATGSYYCWATNCEIPCGTYEFDSEGRMLNPPVEGAVQPGNPVVKNGLVQESDGIYYYVDGKYGPAGITKIGDYYYFVSSKGRVATGSYYCWATNCEIPCGTYQFDVEGRMVNPPV